MENGCHSRAGYKVKQGVINVKFADDEEKPPAITEDDINSHIMGVVLLEHYKMNKGLEMFGERGEKVVTEELQKIHDMNN